MFNSQRINTDPKPWLGPRGRDGVNYGLGVQRFEPRPEFDNNPNPILEAVRIDLETKQPYWTDMEVIERWVGENGLNARGGGYPTYSSIWTLRQAYPRYVNHARKVLERIVNVYGR